MAFLESDPATGVYRVRFRFGGREFKRSLKTTSERAALARVARIEETVALVEQGRIELPTNADIGTFFLSDGKLAGKPELPKVRTLGELFEHYLNSLPEGAKERSTIACEKIHMEHLKKHLGSKAPLVEITNAAMQTYAAKRAKACFRGKPVQPETVRKDLITFRLIWNWAANQGIVSGKAPIKGVYLPKSKEKPPFMTWPEIERIVVRGGITASEEAGLWASLFLTPKDIAELLFHVKRQALRPFILPMFVFAAHTGARRSEILRSRVEDFDFEADTVLIREKKKSKQKAMTYRRVEMSPLLRETITQWLGVHPGGANMICQRPGEEISPHEAVHHFKLTLRKSKWTRLRGFHVFRHSFASNLAAAGVDQRVIDEFLGHQTDEMRRRYRHLLPEQRKKAIAAVFA